jgi:hypothetical protein
MQFVCELSGGLWLNLYGSNVAKRMQQFVSMLRDRYILEFSRPEGLKPGSTLMKVHIEGRDLFIRPAGDGVPMTDEALTPESPTIPPPASPSTPPAPQPPEVSSAAAPSNEPQPPASMGLVAAMGHGQAASTQILFNVRVTPSSSPAKPGDPEVIGTLNPALKHVHLVRYDLAYSLPPDQISLASAPDGTHKGTIDFISMAYDGSGKILNVISQTVRIAVRPDEVAQFMQQPLHVLLQFDLPVGNLFVRVGVLDEPSGRMGTLEIPETVAK